MADFNLNTKLPDLNAINGFVRENLVQPHQDNQNVDSTAKGNSTDKGNSDETRQEVASSDAEKTKATQDLTEEELDDTISQLNDSLQNVQRNLEFSIDKDAGRIVINVKDKETDEVLRQIPSEEILELARNLHNVNIRLNQSINEKNDSYSSQPSAEGVFLKTSV